MFLIITTRDNNVEDIDKADTFQEAVDACIQEAERNGFIPATLSKARLRKELNTAKSYDDGEVTITIRELS